MYFSRQFAHPETLARVRTWLNELGIEHRKVRSAGSGLPRIVLNVEPQRLDAIRMLINAAERNDPDQLLSFWELSRRPYVRPQAIEGETEGDDEADSVGPRIGPSQCLGDRLASRKRGLGPRYRVPHAPRGASEPVGKRLIVSKVNSSRPW